MFMGVLYVSIALLLTVRAARVKPAALLAKEEGSLATDAKPSVTNEAQKYFNLLAEGKNGSRGEVRLHGLRGRMLSANHLANIHFLGRAAMPFVWVFGEDALNAFLGKDLYQICLALGMDKDWMRQKVNLQPPWSFRLVVFRQDIEDDMDCAPATWQGALAWIGRQFPPQVAQKISSQLNQLMDKSFEEIQEAALETSKTNLKMWDVFMDKDDVVKRSYDLTDSSCPGSLYQVRQWLYDRGFREQYKGDGLTTGGFREWLCTNQEIARLPSMAFMDMGSLDPFVSRLGIRRGELDSDSLVPAAKAT